LAGSEICLEGATVFGSIETDGSKIISSRFKKKQPELRKRDKKVAETAGDCRELRNCGSHILKVCNRNSATFFSPQFRNRFGCPQYCGIAEVRTTIAEVWTTIADAHL
jgi:hypothetical protein